MSEEEWTKYTLDFWDRILKGKTTKNLYGWRIKDIGLKYLSEYLKTNKTLTSLELQFNDISPLGAQYISESLKVNNVLTELDLRGNDIKAAGCKYISELLMVNKTLTHLDIEFNQIGESGAIFLCDSLKTNKTITKLSLQANNIRYLGAKYLLNCLKRNHTLKILYLDFNNIYDSRIGNEIEECLKRNESGINKIKYDCGTILLFCRVLLETFNDLPLDVFKIIWKLSGVL